MSLSPGTPLGKYRVRRKLAEGGMAEIYLCDVQGPEGFEKEIVIKRVRANLMDDPSFVKMFIAEARIASRLNHPNLVQIFDFDKHQDTFYLAMEYVAGCSLWELRKRAKEQMIPMPPTLVAQIGAAVARGLGYAHRLTEKGQPLGLVHRDVTPHNVLLSFDGAIKLTDFGIAKAGNKLTSPGMLKGKFAYMSPEQARGEDVDARTDLFALGIVLWEMLTGGRLFDDESDVGVLRAVQETVIAPPARLNPDVPPELDALVVRALLRDKEARFQTAQEMERALTQAMLAHAKRPEDTDLSHYIAQMLESDTLSDEGTAPGAQAPVAPAGVRQPTAVMRKGGSRPKPLNPDENMFAATHVFDRAKKSGEVAPPPAAKATVGMRRGLFAALGLFMVIGVAAVTVSLQRGGAASGQLAQGSTGADLIQRSAERVDAGTEPFTQRPAESGETEGPATPAFGSVTIRVTPWAELFIDGAYQGELRGSKRFRLKVGPHKIRAVHNALRRTANVVVRKEGDSQSIELEPFAR
ncbi:MAG: serine/threonine protein kinase [Myxococcaceae bacterium]